MTGIKILEKPCRHARRPRSRWTGRRGRWWEHNRVSTSGLVGVLRSLRRMVCKERLGLYTVIIVVVHWLDFIPKLIRHSKASNAKGRLRSGRLRACFVAEALRARGGAAQLGALDGRGGGAGCDARVGATCRVGAGGGGRKCRRLEGSKFSCHDRASTFASSRARLVGESGLARPSELCWTRSLALTGDSELLVGELWQDSASLSTW